MTLAETIGMGFDVLGLAIAVRHGYAAGSASVVLAKIWGYRSGRSSCRVTFPPVALSIGSTNSAGGELRFARSSQYQTWDCVVPIRSASGFCPPTISTARFRASFLIGTDTY